jgi:hypothetical protein
VLFSSNPRGNNEEGLSDDRYACFFDLDTWRDYVTSAGFVEVGHYYRPPGLPRHKRRGSRRFGAKASPNFDHFLTGPAEKTRYFLSLRSCNLSILVDRRVAP